MSTVRRVMTAAARILCGRAFLIAALAMVCAVIVAFVSLNLAAVTVTDGDVSRIFLTLHDDPYQADNAELSDGAENIPAENTPAAVLTEGQSEILNVQITADEITTMFTMSGGTIADAIGKSGVDIGNYDKVTVSGKTVDKNASVTDNLHMIVTRVQYREYTKTQKVPFETEIIYTNTLAKGKTQMRNSGTNGVKTLTYRDCIEDGKVVGTELVSEKVTTAPVNASKLVGVITGTPVSPAPFSIALNESGQPVSYTKKFSGKATAYTSDRGDSGTNTAYAGKARVGVVAVDPNKIPYGSKLYIVSEDGSYVYGYAIAGDTGGGVRSGKTLVDLYYNTYEECIRFGRRNMNVYIIG